MEQIKLKYLLIEVRNRVLYDEDGWDVGRVPKWWG